MDIPIGETLRTAREEQGRSFADLTERTRIRERYLRALEEERFDVLGEDVYVKGFLRSYAKALDLDAAPLLEAYRTQFEHPEPDEAALTGEFHRGAERPMPRILRLTAGAGALALVLGLLAVLGQLDGGSSASPPPETGVVAGPAEDAEAEAEEPERDDPEPAGSPAPEPEPEPTPTEPASPPRDEPPGVEVEVLVDGGESWLRATVDGSIVFEGIMTDGERSTYTGEDEVLLRIGNAGVVHLTADGEDHGAAGAPGAVVEHRFAAEDGNA